MVTDLCQCQISGNSKDSAGMCQKKGRLTALVRCDLWSFVSNKGNKQWVWLALDVKAGEIVRVYLGDRSRKGAKMLWQSLPGAYRSSGLRLQIFGRLPQQVIPKSRHRPVGKNSGKTNGIERFNCTLRQRVSRLVRKTLSFSKKLANHVGAIWYARSSLQCILTCVRLPSCLVYYLSIR